MHKHLNKYINKRRLKIILGWIWRRSMSKHELITLNARKVVMRSYGFKSIGKVQQIRNRRVQEWDTILNTILFDISNASEEGKFQFQNMCL